MPVFSATVAALLDAVGVTACAHASLGPCSRSLRLDLAAAAQLHGEGRKASLEATDQIMGGPRLRFLGGSGFVYVNTINKATTGCTLGYHQVYALPAECDTLPVHVGTNRRVVKYLAELPLGVGVMLIGVPQIPTSGLDGNHAPRTILDLRARVANQSDAADRLRASKHPLMKKSDPMEVWLNFVLVPYLLNPAAVGVVLPRILTARRSFCAAGYQYY